MTIEHAWDATDLPEADSYAYTYPTQMAVEVSELSDALAAAKEAKKNQSAYFYVKMVNQSDDVSALDFECGSFSTEYSEQLKNYGFEVKELYIVQGAPYYCLAVHFDYGDSGEA